MRQGLFFGLKLRRYRGIDGAQAAKEREEKIKIPPAKLGN